jgi:hypothetical protein
MLGSVVECGKLLGRMGGMISCIWFTRLEVLVLFSNVVVSGRGGFPLACRNVLLRWAGSRSSLLFCACFLVSLVPVSGVVVACFLGCVLQFVVCGAVKLLLSLPSCLLVL